MFEFVDVEEIQEGKNILISNTLMIILSANYISKGWFMLTLFRFPFYFFFTSSLKVNSIMLIEYYNSKTLSQQKRIKLLLITSILKLVYCEYKKYEIGDTQLNNKYFFFI